MRSKKGQTTTAGLNILLSVVIMLFIIGFMVMIFTILGGELEDTAQDDISGTITNESWNMTWTTDRTLNATGLGQGIVCTINSITNTSDGPGIPSTNYSMANCILNYTEGGGGGTFNETIWSINYSYTGTENTTASGVMRDTSGELAGTIDWFGIIIVITAMLVLILLTVVIISAIRGSGLVALGTGKAPKTTA